MHSAGTFDNLRTADGVSTVLDTLRSAYGDLTSHLQTNTTPIDELVMTILSQHTSDGNTERALRSLQRSFPTWEAVIDAPTDEVVDAIRMGGLANIKAPRIKQVLRDVRERTGGFDLSFLDRLPPEEARDWLTSLTGVGPKTASCVLLFSLNVPVIPVDTHVHRVSLRLGLIPKGTNAERAHRMLEDLVPDERSYEAHVLLIRHGRETCTARRPKCRSCVLVQWCPSAELPGETTGAREHR